ncbi:MAG TPA: hypothetical protein VF139_14450 [Candidatus Polarisedimenticolaceae bacterium]
MSALEERPAAPAADPAMRWIAGCGFGCLALIVLAIVVVAIAVSWLGREGPPRPEEVLADGRESAAFTVDLRADDPAVVDLLTGFQESAQRVGDAQSPFKVPEFFQRMRREDVRRSLPVRLEYLRWRGEGDAAGPWLTRLTLGQGAWKARMAMRLVGWVMSRGEGSRRETVDGVDLLVIGPKEDNVAATVVSNRVLISRDAALLRRSLDPGGRVGAEPEAAAESATLLAAVAIDGEDGRGYLRPVGALSTPDGAPPIAIAAGSFEIASRDVVRFRVAVRCASAPTDANAAAEALEAWVTAFPRINDVRVVREREPFWLDPATLVIEGRVEGIEGLLGSLFSAKREGAANP